MAGDCIADNSQVGSAPERRLIFESQTANCTSEIVQCAEHFNCRQYTNLLIHQKFYSSPGISCEGPSVHMSIGPPCFSLHRPGTDVLRWSAIWVRYVQSLIWRLNSKRSPGFHYRRHCRERESSDGFSKLCSFSNRKYHTRARMHTQTNAPPRTTSGTFLEQATFHLKSFPH